MPDRVPLSRAAQRLNVGSELPGLLVEFGVDPAEIFSEIGVELASVGPDLRLPFADILHLLSRAAQVTGRSHIGLLCGLRFELRHHGPIGVLMQNAPTMRQALEDFVRWQPGYSSGAVVYLHRTGRDHALGYGCYAGTTAGVEILYDTVVGVALRIVSSLSRGTVAPLEVHLSRRAPPNAAEYYRLLHVPVRFEMERSCLVLDERAMQAEIPFADARKRQETLDLIRRHTGWADLSCSHRVRHEIRRALLDGPPRMAAVAGALGQEVRTLRRKLKAEDTSFSQLSDEVRMAVAQELLDLTSLPIGDIAAATGFSSSSVFSETFRRWTGTTASAVRARRPDATYA